MQDSQCSVTFTPSCSTVQEQQCAAVVDTVNQQQCEDGGEERCSTVQDQVCSIGIGDTNTDADQ